MNALPPGRGDETARPFSATFGAYTQTVWTDRRSLSWPELVEVLTRHTVGRKEGTCIVPAVFRGDQRAKSDAERIDVAFLDSDAGATLDEIATAAQSAGWAAVVSSTHSHLTTFTKAKQENWRKFKAARPADAEAAYLVEVKGMLPRVAAGATVASETEEFVFLQHQPCAKFRVAIPLQRPWLAADYPSQDVANAVWKERIESLAAALGLQHDQACTDTSRLFFLPRRPADGPPAETCVIEGAPCDIFALAEPAGGAFDADLGANTASGGKTDSRASQAGDSDDYIDPDTGEVFSLRDWAREYGDKFLIADVLRARRPSALTGRVVDGIKVHIRCPNESAHTTPGADGATFVTNAGQANNRGFVVHCRHAHCDGKDRLFFVKGMLAEGWLSISDLTDQQFIAPPPEDAGPSPHPGDAGGKQQRRGSGADDGEPPVLFDPWANLQPPAFPIDAIPTVLRAFVESRAEVIGADPCALSWAALAACSTALDGRIRLHMKRHDAWSVPPFLWVALVGAPSSKKTPILDAAFEPLLRAQDADLRPWREAHKRWEALPRKERAETPEPVCRRRLISHDATIESLQDILGQQDRGVGVLRDELAGWIGSLEKYAGARGSLADRAFFLQSFNGGPYVVDRVSRGTVAIDNLGLSIVGGIQPDRLRQLGDITVDGLWQRFLPFIVAPASLGSDAPASDTTTDYIDLIDRLLRIPPETRIQLSDAAHVIREDVGGRLFEIEQSEALGSAFSAFCGKLHGLWGRLCLVLSQIEPAGAPYVVQERIADMARILIFQSVLPNASRIYAGMGGAGGNIEATRAVGGYILTKHKDRVLASDLAHNVRACRGQTLEDVQKIVSPLVAGGWLVPAREFNPHCWIVHPYVHQHFALRAEQETVRRATVRALITGNARREDANAE